MTHENYGTKEDRIPFLRNITISISDSQTKNNYSVSIKATRKQFEEEFEDLIVVAKEKVDIMIRKALNIDTENKIGKAKPLAQ